MFIYFLFSNLTCFFQTFPWSVLQQPYIHAHTLNITQYMITILAPHTHTYIHGGESPAALNIMPPTPLPPCPLPPITGPLFTTPLNSSTSLVVPSSLTLVCVANNSPGSPNLAASWSYPQRPGDPRVLVSVTLLGNSTVTTRLSVTNVSSNDSGVYTCNFSNGILKGGINSSTLVSVLCKLKLRSSLCCYLSICLMAVAVAIAKLNINYCAVTVGLRRVIWNSVSYSPSNRTLARSKI